MPIGPEFPFKDGPSPGAPGVSLERSALVIDHGPDDMRWANGLTFQPESCRDSIVFNPCATTGTATWMLDNQNRPAARPYTPFVVDAYDRCSTFGWIAADYEARARRLLAARESKAIAREFWTGALIPANAHLAATAPNVDPNNTVTTVGIGLSPHNALAELDQAIGDGNGGAGMIHVRLRLLQMLVGQAYLRYENGQYYTATGVKVVADAGYPGTGPAGQPVTNVTGSVTEWAFATDLVEVHRGPVEVFARPYTAESVKHQTNDEIVRAQRLVAPIFNGCVLAAVSVTTPATDV